MDTYLTPTNPDIVAEREAAVQAAARRTRSRPAAAAGDPERERDASAPRSRRHPLDVVTPLLFVTLVAGLLALVAMGATVR